MIMRMIYQSLFLLNIQRPNNTMFCFICLSNGDCTLLTLQREAELYCKTMAQGRHLLIALCSISHGYVVLDGLSCFLLDKLVMVYLQGLS